MTCKAVCYIADDHGDNEATCKCQLEKGHDGLHLHAFRDDTCKLTFTNDERDCSRGCRYYVFQLLEEVLKRRSVRKFIRYTCKKGCWPVTEVNDDQFDFDAYPEDAARKCDHWGE